MALVLTRRIGEAIIVDGKTEIVIADIKGGQVKFAITAPREIVIDRKEINQRKKEPPR